MIWIILAFSALLYGITRMIVNIFRNEGTDIIIMDSKDINRMIDDQQQETNMKKINEIINND